MSQHINTPTRLNDRMLKLLLDANRKRIKDMLTAGKDSFSVSRELFPRPESVHEDSINRVMWEIELIKASGRSSLDGDFFPALKGYTSFTSYILDCWHVLTKMQGRKKPTELADVNDNRLISTMVQFCELPKVVEAVVTSTWKYSTVASELDNLCLPSEAYRKQLLAELDKAEGYRQLVKLLHSVILTEAEVTEHLDKLTAIDLSWGYPVTYVAWLYDEEGNRVRKLQDMPVTLMPQAVMGISESNPNHKAMEAVHTMNMQLIDKVSIKSKEADIKSADAAERARAAKEAEDYAKRVKDVTAKVNSGTATAEELEEFLTWR